MTTRLRKYEAKDFIRVPFAYADGYGYALNTSDNEDGPDKPDNSTWVWWKPATRERLTFTSTNTFSVREHMANMGWQPAPIRPVGKAAVEDATIHRLKNHISSVEETLQRRNQTINDIHENYQDLLLELNKYKTEENKTEQAADDDTDVDWDSIWQQLNERVQTGSTVRDVGHRPGDIVATPQADGEVRLYKVKETDIWVSKDSTVIQRSGSREDLQEVLTDILSSKERVDAEELVEQLKEHGLL